jgi:hypothetical protein
MGDNFYDSGDDVYGDGVPLLTGGGGAAAFHEHTDSSVVVEGTQDTPNVSIPDSFVAAPRFVLPQPPNASMPPGKRAAHDRLKPSWTTFLPNVHRNLPLLRRDIACHIACGMGIRQSPGIVGNCHIQIAWCWQDWVDGVLQEHCSGTCSRAAEEIRSNGQ